MENLRDFLRISEAADYLGVSPNTLRNWENAGKIAAHRHPVNGYPALLVADPSQTLIWDEPIIFFAADHCRNFHKWSSLGDLVASLREAR